MDSEGIAAGQTFCVVCSVNCRTAEKYQAHIQSELHKTITSLRDPSTIASIPDPLLIRGKKTPVQQNQGASPPANTTGFGQNMPSPDVGRGRGYNFRGARGGLSSFEFGGRGRSAPFLTGQTPYNNFVRPGAEAGQTAKGSEANFASESIDEKSLAAKVNKQPMPRKKYYCEVCDATMSGPESFEQHIKGGKHKKVLQKSGASVVEKKVTPVKYRVDRPLHLQSALDVVTMSLVGLQYLVEFQHPDPTMDPVYDCYLCDSQMDMRNVIAHITGLKHKHTYLKIHYAHLLKEVQVPDVGRMPRSGERKSIILQHVDEIAATEGRQKVSVYIWDRKGDKPDVHTGAAPAIKRTAPFPNTGPAAKKQPVTNASTAGGTSALMKLVEAVEGFEIANEVQAALILRINVSLSNALKKYRNEPITNFSGPPANKTPNMGPRQGGGQAAGPAAQATTAPPNSNKKPLGAPPKPPSGANHGGRQPPPHPPQPQSWNYDNWQQYGYGDYGYGNYGYDNGFFNSGSYGYGY